MRLLYLLALLLLLAACTTPPAPAATPLPPTDPAAAPPSETPLPAGDVPTNMPIERATLPPTWTPPVDVNADTPTPTEVTLVPDLTSEALRFQPTLAACDAFVFDRNTTPRTFRLGEPVTISWGAPFGAARYRVSLLDQTLAPLFVQNTTATTFSFPANVFQFGGLYGWEVRPLDLNGVQFCLPIGGELTMATS